MRLPIAALAATSPAAIALGGATAPAEPGRAAAKKITARGVDGVKLGLRHTTLRQRGLVGPIRQGCVLGGPNNRSAKPRPPPQGRFPPRQRGPRRRAATGERSG